MFFSKARKLKKVADAVLVEVQPVVALAERQAGKKISMLRGDNYVLGFVTGLSGLTVKRIASNLSGEDTGVVLDQVIEQIYGKDVIDRKRLGDLFSQTPQPDLQFKNGFEGAAKIQLLLYGRHRLHDDPDYKNALDAVRRGAGHTLSLITPGASEDSQVASLLLNQYFLQPVLEKLAKL